MKNIHWNLCLSVTNGSDWKASIVIDKFVYIKPWDWFGYFTLNLGGCLLLHFHTLKVTTFLLWVNFFSLSEENASIPDIPGITQVLKADLVSIMTDYFLEAGSCSGADNECYYIWKAGHIILTWVVGLVHCRKAIWTEKYLVNCGELCLVRIRILPNL